MTFPAPFALSAGAAGGWAATDWTAPTKATSPAGADGVVQADFGQLDNDVMWLVDRAVVSCTSSAATAVRLYDTSPAPKQLLSGTAVGNFDEADFPAGLLVRPSTSLLVVWTGCTAGAIGTCRLQVRIFRRRA